MSVSKTILVGTLGKNPEIKTTSNGKMVANFSLATSKKWKNANGEKQEKTSWHNITCFDGLAKLCDYIEKGSKIYLEGELDYQEWDDKETGQKKYRTIINANAIDIIKGKARDEGISQHAVDKGNAFVSEEPEEDCPF
jgi:single-strand DNA-binding protein